MLIAIQGGPFHGETIQAPRRTTPGLRLTLQNGSTEAEYRLERVGNRVVAAFVETLGERCPARDPAAAPDGDRHGRQGGARRARRR